MCLLKIIPNGLFCNFFKYLHVYTSKQNRFFYAFFQTFIGNHISLEIFPGVFFFSVFTNFKRFSQSNKRTQTSINSFFNVRRLYSCRIKIIGRMTMFQGISNCRGNPISETTISPRKQRRNLSFFFSFPLSLPKFISQTHFRKVGDNQKK